MILGIEIVLTIGGLYMLIMGRGWGKNSPSHWQFRLLGLFAMTVIPVVVVVGITFGVVWVLTHPNVAEQKIKEDMHWPMVGVEFAIVVTYAIAATLWDKALRKRLAGGGVPADTATPI